MQMEKLSRTSVHFDWFQGKQQILKTKQNKSFQSNNSISSNTILIFPRTQTSNKIRSMAERGAQIHYTTWVHGNQRSIQFRTASKISYWRCALRAMRQMYGKVTESTLRCHMLAVVHLGWVHSFRGVSSCLWANSMNRMLRLWASVFCDKNIWVCSRQCTLLGFEVFWS